MKAIKLTWKERRAVQRSINHWERDIIKYLVQGKKIITWESRDTSVWDWRETGKSVQCNTDFCPLCKQYEEDECIACPYQKFYHRNCDEIGGHWRKWRDKPSLRTARAMVASLQRILDKEVTDGSSK